MSARERYERAWRLAEKRGLTKELARYAELWLAELESAEQEYDAIRWGKDVDRHLELEVAAVRPGQPLAELGVLEYVEYSGVKGADPETVYQHHFKRRYPRLLVCAGKLVVAGGDYRVTERGIVG